MIDLFSVKFNKDYDFIQAEVPTGSGTWLCSETNSNYVKGYSYEVVEGVATRIDVKEDYLINNSIYSTIESVLNYLNNLFYIKNPNFNGSLWCDCFPYDAYYYNYLYNWGALTFKNGSISPVSNIKQGDLIHVIGERNRYFSYVTNVLDNTITIDNQSLVNCTETAYIFVSGLPQSVQNIISKMIAYDVFNREAPNDLKSENIGSYSYTKADYLIGSMAYPSEIVSGLENFKRVRFT